MAVSWPDVVCDGHVVRGDADQVRDAAGGGHHLVVRGGVEVFVVSPHEPGLRHQLCLETAAAQGGLGEVPSPGHTVVRVPGVIHPDVSDHLGQDGVDHLLSEDVGQDPGHGQDDQHQQHEHGVGEQQTFDLLDCSKASEE